MSKFIHALYANNINLARELLAGGENPNVMVNVERSIPLFIRIIYNDNDNYDDWIELFHEFNVDLVIHDVNGHKGNTLLHEVILTHKIRERTLKNCLKWGIDVNAKNDDGDTPLKLAVIECCSFDPSMDIIHFLVDNGADINNVDRDGNSALLWALLQGGRPELISYFLEKGSVGYEEDLVHYVNIRKQTVWECIERLSTDVAINEDEHALIYLKLNHALKPETNVIDFLNNVLEGKDIQINKKEGQEVADGCVIQLGVTSSGKYGLMIKENNSVWYFSKS